MPIRQMKESLEPHILIKTHMQNSTNSAQKEPKTYQNGKGPPFHETQSGKTQNHCLPQTKNRVRRRGRGGRKSDRGDVFMRPSSRPCTVADKPVLENLVKAIVPATLNGCFENGGNMCKIEMSFPTSSKSLSFTPRPGYGQLGTKCIVKSNHFFTVLPDKDLNQYDVSLYFHLFFYFLFLSICKRTFLNICWDKK